MIRCFLSHSSKDKKFYIEIVAKKVGIANCIYDKFTFEEGMRPLDEILKGLNKTDLFVLFLSENALQSEWVNFEIINAKRMLDSSLIDRIFPIIIDENIHYSDKRIPQWMRDEYNLKYISRPVIAAGRIRQRLREISWKTHPNLKEKSNIFVGRNSLINTFEERIDDFDKIKPSCVIATGVPSIGRRSLLAHCLIKSNIFDESYRPSYIYLNAQDSIEDLIIKIYDLGFSKDRILPNFMSTLMQDKVKLAIDLADDIQKSREVVFLIDHGCIVTYDRQICEWYINIINEISNSEILTFCVISRYLPDSRLMRELNHTFVINVPELSIKERKGLILRYSKEEGLNLSKNDLAFFLNLLSGYPEQIFFTVNLIKDINLAEAKNASYLIVEYNSLKVQHLLSKWEDEEAINFLRLLSEFEFISYDLVFEIVGEDATYRKLIEDFRTSALVEFIGANKEYISVSDNVRDYVRRQRLKLKDEYRDKLSIHVNNFLKTYKNEEKDLSDFLYSLKASLKAGELIEEKYLIPSHFLKTIKELYDEERKYSEVVKLADKVLESNQYLDPKFLQNVRYYLCLALARLRNPRCVQEAHAFTGAELNFILGFYYLIT